VSAALIPYLAVPCAGSYCTNRNRHSKDPDGAYHVVNGGDRVEVGYRHFCTGGFCRVERVDDSGPIKRAYYVRED
jgi:hypothetical protein